ncbi:MAG TPA: hypothetical protein VJ506_10950 [Candidatus Limnocylindrales bacterium]|nr:hypothetical protein [Candidatus Limnocylindrales bacterium]
MTAPGLSLVPMRSLFVEAVEIGFELHPGDRTFVAAEQRLEAGAGLAARLRDPHTAIVAGPVDAEAAVPGEHWAPAPGRRPHEGEVEPSGELLFRSGGRWRIGTGEHDEPLASPVGGTVIAARPGIEIRVRSEARGILGVETLGGPASGRLSVVTGPDGEVRAPHVDVSASGAILVVGARIDAEALTRARAVGVRGVIVAALGVKERRDFLASERRGRAAVHGLPPFGILVLDGAAGRPIASPVMTALHAMEGRIVALVADPACVVVEDGEVELTRPADDLVRVRSGPLVGAEGQWAGLAGPRRFPGGVVLEAGLVRFGDRPAVAVPLGDLERFA